MYFSFKSRPLDVHEPCVLPVCPSLSRGPCAADTGAHGEQQCTALLSRESISSELGAGLPPHPSATYREPSALYVLWQIPTQDPTPQLHSDSLHPFLIFFYPAAGLVLSHITPLPFRCFAKMLRSALLGAAGPCHAQCQPAARPTR